MGWTGLAMLLAAQAKAAGRSEAGFALAAQQPATTAEEPVSADDPYAAPGGYDLSGLVQVGYRRVGVNGSEGAFEENLNLDDGFVLSNLVLSGERLEPGSGPESFGLRAEGLGDPYSQVALDLDEGAWRTSAGYSRSSWVGTTDSDQHRFDVLRESASLAVRRRPAGRDQTRSGIEVSWVNRDGMSVGSQSFAFGFLRGFPVRREDRALGVRGDVGGSVAGLEVELALGLERRESDDRRDVATTQPAFPNDPITEDFDAETEGFGHFGELRLARELVRDWTRIDLGLGWQRSEATGRLASFETGYFFDPSLPYERTTDADLDLEAREIEFDAGLQQRLEVDVDLELRWTRAQEDGSGELDRIEVLDELMGDPPSTSFFEDTSDSQSTLDLFEVGLSTPLWEAGDLEVRLEYGHEEIDVEQIVDGVTVRFFDGTVSEWGGETTLSAELSKSVSLDLGAGWL